MYDRVLDSIVQIIQPWTDMPVRRAVLPVGEGVSLEKSTSGVIGTALDRSTIEEMTCVLNAKSQDLKKAREALGVMHQRLTRLAEYPNNADWQITAIETVSGPTEIGREANGFWLVGSSIRVKFYNKEGAYHE